MNSIVHPGLCCQNHIWFNAKWGFGSGGSQRIAHRLKNHGSKTIPEYAMENSNSKMVSSPRKPKHFADNSFLTQ